MVSYSHGLHNRRDSIRIEFYTIRVVGFTSSDARDLSTVYSERSCFPVLFSALVDGDSGKHFKLLFRIYETYALYILFTSECVNRGFEKFFFVNKQSNLENKLVFRRESLRGWLVCVGSAWSLLHRNVYFRLYRSCLSTTRNRLIEKLHEWIQLYFHSTSNRLSA